MNIDEAASMDEAASIRLTIRELRAENAKLRAALEPFAAYADKRHVVPGSMVITNGSSLAKGQLTMGDCYNANKALANE